MVLRANASRLKVHQIATALAVDTVSLARTFRGPGGFARGDQLVRAGLSVVSNIAEACGRGTVREFRLFIRYARASAHETRAQLVVARALDPSIAGWIRTLENRTSLAIKMLSRVEHRPPPDTPYESSGRRSSTFFLDASNTVLDTSQSPSD